MEIRRYYMKLSIDFSAVVVIVISEGNNVMCEFLQRVKLLEGCRGRSPL